MGQSTPIGSKTILIVEDEALVRFDLVDFFEHAGWRVFDASNADEAITIFDAHKEIRVVLTDVQMPGSMDGIKLAHFVRERFPPTVLFVVSGNVPVTPDKLARARPSCQSRSITIGYCARLKLRSADVARIGNPEIPSFAGSR